MIFLKRKRLIFWLLRAYIKKWGKTITVSFVLGLLVFAFLFLKRDFFLSKIPLSNNESIGIVGVYDRTDLPNNLPPAILNQASRGLTKVSPEGVVLPDIALRWEIKDDGKTFIFYLRPNTYFSDGKLVDTGSIKYNFKDVTIEKPSKQVIVFRLKEKYSPFLVTLSNYKIFKNSNIGVSDYRISEIKSSSGFIDYIKLFSQKDKKTIKYDFYDTQEALKSAYALGEVTKIVDINDLNYKNRVNFSEFKNADVDRQINFEKIVTIFFDNQDPLLSDKKLRKALAYSLPDKFDEGQRTYTPYTPKFWANGDQENYKKDLEYSKLLFEQTDASKSASLKIELKALPQYQLLAKKIAKSWKQLGVNTDIKVVDSVPQGTYQAFLGELPVFKDPDQYTLWHTGQESNITNYRNLRIDKLLEDGRRIYDIEQRKEIYSDFQKYLIDDMPAAFLFFPYTYSVTRK